MHHVMSYVKTKKIHLSNANIYSVSIAADYLDIEELQQACINYLKHMISNQTWNNIFRFSRKLCLHQVESSCMDEFYRVHCNVDTAQYSVNEIQDILRDQQKKMFSKVAFDVLLSWVKFHSVKRRHYFTDFLKFVNFNGLKTPYVSDEICHDKILSQDLQIVRQISQNLANRRLLIVGGLTSKAEKNCVKYCPVNKSFASCADAPNICQASSCAMHGNVLIVASGTGNAFDIQTYNVNSNMWNLQKSVLSVARYNASAAVLNNKLYLVGGYDVYNRKRLKSVDSFCINQDGSYSRDDDDLRPLSLNEARTDHAALPRGNEIFVIGGFTEGATETGGYERTYLKTCEVLNTVNGERYNIASLKEGRQHLAAVIFEGEILAIGGKGGVYEKLSSVESYSFATRQWSLLPGMSVARYGHCACVHNGNVFVVGGNRTKSIESYDPVKQHWTHHQNIEVSRWGSFVAPVVSNNAV